MYTGWRTLLLHPRTSAHSRWTSHHPKPFELAPNAAAQPSASPPSRPPPPPSKLAIPPLLAALTTAALTRASHHALSPPQALPPAQPPQAHRAVSVRRSTFLATSVAAVPMPPEPAVRERSGGEMGLRGPARDRDAGRRDGLRMNPAGKVAVASAAPREPEECVESPVDPARVGGFAAVDESLLEDDSPATLGIGRAV